MFEHLLALAVPIAGLVCAVLFQLHPDPRRRKPRNPMKGDASDQSQGDDHRRKGEKK